LLPGGAAAACVGEETRRWVRCQSLPLRANADDCASVLNPSNRMKAALARGLGPMWLREWRCRVGSGAGGEWREAAAGSDSQHRASLRIECCAEQS